MPGRLIEAVAANLPSSQALSWQEQPACRRTTEHEAHWPTVVLPRTREMIMPNAADISVHTFIAEDIAEAPLRTMMAAGKS